MCFAAPKVATVFSGKAFDPRQKGKACPFNAFLPTLPMDHLEDRRMAEFYCRGRGKEKPASLNTQLAPRKNWGKSRDTMCCPLLGSLHLPPPHLFPAPLEVWDGISGHGVLGGWGSKADTARIKCPGAWSGDINIKKKRKRKKRKGSCVHAHKSIKSVMHLSLIKSHPELAGEPRPLPLQFADWHSC